MDRTRRFETEVETKVANAFRANGRNVATGAALARAADKYLSYSNLNLNQITIGVILVKQNCLKINHQKVKYSGQRRACEIAGIPYAT